jgi:hypothetical protein
MSLPALPSKLPLVLNRAQDEATIAVPSETTRGDSSISLVIARLDLKQVRWSKPLQLAPPPALQTYYRNDLSLIGYREDSSELILVASDSRALLIKANDEVIDIPTNLPSKLFPTTSSISAADNRYWGTCPESGKIFGKAEPCSLVSTSVLGPLKTGPTVTSPLLTHQKHVLQWVAPSFHIDTGQALVFGGYPARGIHPFYYVWVANLADGSVRQMTFLGSFHDDALTGAAALSPDSSVLAFTVARSKLGCCLVDNYIDLGERIVIADLQSKRQIASVTPPRGKSLLGFAVDHRSPKTILVVNWGDGWERKEFSRP